MGDRPAIKKVKEGPYNKSKRKNPKFFSSSVKKVDRKIKINSIRKKPRPLHNESLTKGEVYRQGAFSSKYEKYKKQNNIQEEHPELVNMYGAFSEDEEKPKVNWDKFGNIIIAIVIIGYILFKFISCIGDDVEDKKRKANIFKGQEYYSYLGISKTDSFEESLYETYDLEEIDNIAVGKYVYEGETYYRFQAKKDGRLAYDNEITNYQGEIEPTLDGSKPTVAVYKRIYTKSNGQKVSIFYYKLRVPDNKIKTLT